MLRFIRVLRFPSAAGPAAALLALALATPAAAQPAFELTLGGSLASLDEAAFGETTRGVARGAFEFEQLFDGERARLTYSLDAGTYATAGDWRSFLHTAELVRRFEVQAAGRGSVFLGAAAALRDNGDAWGAADYRAAALTANSRWRVGERATLRLGYRFDLRRFPDLAALDQEQHDGFASLLVNLPSRTTLIGEVHLGAKSYAGETTVVASPAPEPSTPAARRHGAGPGGLGPDVRPVIVTTTSDATHARQVAWLARVAQSLADRTGLSVQYSRRSTSGRVPPALVTTPAGFFDDGVYDDPFASDARSWRVALKQAFAAGGSLEVWGLRFERDFNGVAALDAQALPLVGGELRRDRVWRAGAGLRQPLLRGRSGRPTLALELGYDFTDHVSNDAFYNYKAHAGGLALSIAF